jgi:hypothetical protein
VEGHRRYADEPDPTWYSGQSPYEGQTTNPYDSGVHERPGGVFRLPEQRPADPGYTTPAPYGALDPLTTTGSHARPVTESDSGRIPARGPEYPTIRPGGATSLADAPAPATTYGMPPSSGPAAGAEPTSVVPPVAGPDRGRAPESVYRTRHPASAVLVAIGTVLLMVPVALLLVRVTFVDDPAVRGVVPAVLLALGLPLTSIGLYSLTAGGGPAGGEVWLRPPVAYLPVGLVLLLAAGLAVA